MRIAQAEPSAATTVCIVGYRPPYFTPGSGHASPSACIEKMLMPLSYQRKRKLHDMLIRHTCFVSAPITRSYPAIRVGDNVLAQTLRVAAG